VQFQRQSNATKVGWLINIQSLFAPIVRLYYLILKKVLPEPEKYQSLGATSFSSG